MAEQIPIEVINGDGTQLTAQTVAAGVIKTHAQEFTESLRDDQGRYVQSSDGTRITNQTVSGKKLKGPMIGVFEEDRLGSGTIVFSGAPSEIPAYHIISQGIY